MAAVWSILERSCSIMLCIYSWQPWTDYCLNDKVMKCIFHVKCKQKNTKFGINLLNLSEIFGISCGHEGKIWDNFFLLICHGVSELWLSKVLSFPHTWKNFHVLISGDIHAMTMKQVSLESY